jgi:hypothetical protein
MGRCRYDHMGAFANLYVWHDRAAFRFLTGPADKPHSS